MRPDGSPLHLKHSPNQTAVPDLKAWTPFPGTDFYESGANRVLIATESRPTRNIKGGTPQNEPEGGSGDFSGKTGDPRSFAQPQNYNCEASPSNVAQVDSVSPWQISASQSDTSNASISSSEGLGEKRKRRTESGDEGVYPCRFCGQFFPKSQALGGHMNRHRQERENEQVRKARELLEKQRSHHPNYWSSQNTPYASDPDINIPNYVIPDDWASSILQSRPAYASTTNLPYDNSQGRNQDTMQTQANPSRAWPGSVGVPRNYLHTQVAESTNAVAESLNPAFQTHSGYPLQSMVPGSDFSSHGLEALQQFNSPSFPTEMQLMTPNSNMSIDLRKPSGALVDGQSLPWPLGYLPPGSTPTAGSMQNEQNFGLALVSDAMAIESSLIGPSPNSHGMGLSQLRMKDEGVQWRQRQGNNYIAGADLSSLFSGNDFNQMADPRYNQGVRKNP